MHVFYKMYSLIPVVYKPKNLRAPKYKIIPNEGYLYVLTEFFYVHGYINSLRKCRNYSVSSPYAYLLSLLSQYVHGPYPPKSGSSRLDSMIR